MTPREAGGEKADPLSLARAVKGTFWRIVAPRWQADPLSGAGAAKWGGRLNAKGESALYLSVSPMTAFAEYQQELGVRPGTLMAFDVAAAPIIDLTDAAVLAALKVDPGVLRSAWKAELFIAKTRPRSWRLAHRLRIAGLGGALYASTQMSGGANLVLWHWNEPGSAAARVQVLDPLGDLGPR